MQLSYLLDGQNTNIVMEIFREMHRRKQYIIIFASLKVYATPVEQGSHLVELTAKRVCVYMIGVAIVKL